MRPSAHGYPDPTPATARGIVLAEVLVALALLIAVVASAVQLLVYTARAAQHGQRLTRASVLAAQKIEQLATLAWTYDQLGAPLTDSRSDVTHSPESPAGGTGLAYGAAATLAANTHGYCDFVDATGRSLGGGTSPPEETAFVRRWAIRPLKEDPVDTLVLVVRVLSAEAAASNGHDPAGVTLAVVRTRDMW